MVSLNIKTICIIQARITSSRLPNKVLQPLGNGDKTILEHVYERLLLSNEIDKIVFAIPDTNTNDSLFDFLQKRGISVFRGDENNVLLRYYECAKQYSPQIIVRATCDNPLVDWQSTDKAIRLLIDKKYDYVNMKGFPLGTGVEVFTWEALSTAYNQVCDCLWKEHVTPFFYKNPDIFNLGSLYNTTNQTDMYRLTVDTKEDYELIKIIYDELYDGLPIPIEIVISFLNKHPKLLTKNSIIKQIRL
jgi:spore coat polysaccharide biosynthesis protein SpsF